MTAHYTAHVALLYFTWHSIKLHTLQYMKFTYIKLRPLRYNSLHDIFYDTLHYIHYITSHYISSKTIITFHCTHYITFRQITFHCITLRTLHCIALHDIAWHSSTFPYIYMRICLHTCIYSMWLFRIRHSHWWSRDRSNGPICSQVDCGRVGVPVLPRGMQPERGGQVGSPCSVSQGPGAPGVKGGEAGLRPFNYINGICMTMDG